MISKENFIKYINDFRNLCNIYENINKAAEKLDFFSIYNTEYEVMILDILQDVFNDKENDLIGYFIYELNYGEKWEESCIRDKDGKDIPLRNAEELYDILVKNMEIG